MLSFIGWVKRSSERYPQMEYPVKPWNGKFLYFRVPHRANRGPLVEELVAGRNVKLALRHNPGYYRLKIHGIINMQCSKCGSDGPFYDSVEASAKVYGYCKPCSRAAVTKLGKEIKKARRAKKETVVPLFCRTCGKDRPSTDFAPSAAAGIIMGFYSTCRSCRKPVAHASYLRRKEKLAAQKADDFSDLV